MSESTSNNIKQPQLQEDVVVSANSSSSSHQKPNSSSLVHLLHRENLKKFRKVPHPLHHSVRALLFKTLRSYVISTTVVSIAMVLVVSLFFYSAWNQTLFFKTRIGVAIINRDGSDGNGKFGTILAGAFLKAAPYHYYVPNKTIDNVEEYVRKGHCYVAVEIPANFTKNLVSSLYYGLPYRNNTVQVIFDEGRAYSTLMSVRRAISMVVSAVSINVAQSIVANHTYVTGADPLAIVNPYQIRERNLQPVEHTGQEFASSLTYTYLALFAMVGVNNILAAVKPLEGRILPLQLVLMRVTMGVLYNALISIFLTLLILLFGSQLNKGFGVFWLFNWMVMCSFSAFFAFVAVTLGPAGSALSSLFLSLNMTSSGALVNSDLMPRLFKYGMGLPMFHAVKGAKTITYGSYDRLAMNIPVLIAWIVVFLSLSMISSWLKFAVIILRAVPDDIVHSVQLDPPVPTEAEQQVSPKEEAAMDEQELHSDEEHLEDEEAPQHS